MAASLYLSESVREGLGQTLRPGGEILTRRMLELATLRSGCVVLDAGCGTGATLRLLEEDYGVQGVGLDLDAGLLREARHKGMGAVQADLAYLPVAGCCADMILCECAWNLTDKERTLAEFARVLKPGGALLLSDIFARGKRDESWPVRCCFAQATTLEETCFQVEAAGFFVEIVEDHSPLLARTAADFVFRHGSLRGFWQAVTGNAEMADAACQAAKSSRPGLFLLVAKRENSV